MGAALSLVEVWQHITGVFADFVDPGKRVFVGYLGLSLLIALVWLVVVKHQSGSGALRKVFDRKVFFSRSSIADYKIFVINQVITGYTSQILVIQTIATAIYFALHRQEWISSGIFAETPKGVIVALFTLTAFLVDDFTKYLVHRWMHKWPLLWSIHKVHHSAETLTPVTVYRVHPLEAVLYAFRGTLAQGTVIPLFLFLFGGAVNLYLIFGVNVLVFAFHITGSNLRHSHISISYWPWLERILISPAQHQLHHSIAEEHYDKNFGAALALWDWLAGSLHLSERERELEFGLVPEEQASATVLWQIYTAPFVEIGRAVWRYLPSGAKPTKTKPDPTR